VNLKSRAQYRYFQKLALGIETNPEITPERAQEIISEVNYVHLPERAPSETVAPRGKYRKAKVIR